MISTEKTVFCDECSKWVRYGVSTDKAARRFARDEGWACHSGGDFCPDCNTK